MPKSISPAHLIVILTLAALLVFAALAASGVITPPPIAADLLERIIKR